jgi:alpha-amylase/alpha-mannosidase (GH57 family)
MTTSEPLNVAFVWHMHQPYYRLGRGAPFEMPWARLHALKDYLDMVQTLSAYPDVHQTFNLVPSLVEQLEDYATGDFQDVYWEHTIKPAADLEPAERAFVLERMCERPGHPRARSYPRYLELAHKREANSSQGWEACAGVFSVDELRDLQVWFNLAWFEPQALDGDPLADLIRRGRDFSEDDKRVLAEAQSTILARTLPAYREAAARGQIEISTSPYFHPILPLLANSDSARVSVADALLPSRRFAHAEDGREQVRMAVAKHEAVFGRQPRGMWCSEQAVGEDVIPLLLEAGFAWTISDEMVLRRSLSGTVDSLIAGPRDAGTTQTDALALYHPYILEREGGRLNIVFRDHTLSDLIGFAYQSWDSRDAASDLLSRLLDIRSRLIAAGDLARDRAGGSAGLPLVTVALDGENAWEYYPRDGRSFLEALYAGLSADPRLRCVTVSEHLEAAAPVRSLPWLHTGSWIGGDLATWIGDATHGAAWDALHRARDEVAGRESAGRAVTPGENRTDVPGENVPGGGATDLETAWHHIHIAEGSDWFWWFGEHHHTDLDHVWDLNFRRNLREAYAALRVAPPLELFVPLLQGAPAPAAVAATGPIHPLIDGRMGRGVDDLADEWSAAGLLAPDLPSTMQRAERTRIHEVRYGWYGQYLCLLVVPYTPSALQGLEVDVCLTFDGEEHDVHLAVTLEAEGKVRTECRRGPCLEISAGTTGAWHDVLELSLPVGREDVPAAEMGLILHVGRDGMTEHTFQSASLASSEEEST